ncbi:MAG: cyclic nucleotide-binding domain-containing protein [Lachnospiraceae bacterium]|nr:cyclic nucleotide-binding domain-containing protein [Lachnospiraceae bacterium]
MSVDLNINGTNSIIRDSVIYEKGEPVQSVALIVKGRVTVQADGIKMVLGSGNFLGMYDVEAKVHSFTYTALDDLVLYGLPVSNLEQACLLLEEKPQYRGLLVTSINFLMADINKMYVRLWEEAERAGIFVLDMYKTYIEVVKESGLVPEKMSSIERLEEQETETPKIKSELKYFLQSGKIPVEAQKNFYGGNAYVAQENFKKQCGIIPDLTEACRHYSELLYRYFRIMIMDEKNLFSLVGKMALSIKQSGQDTSKLSAMLDELLEKINKTESTLIEVAGVAPNLNRERMEQIYFALLSDEAGDLKTDEKDDISVLNGSLLQILEYAPVHGKVAGEFEEAVEAFLGLADKFARTPEAAAVRKRVSQNFFEIYEAVVKKSFEDPNPPLAVSLFLRYGYVSEELLTADEIRTLLSLPSIENQALDCKVYTMPMWLKEIAEGRKNPSKDEFDTDFEEQLRQEMMEKKRDKMSAEEAFENPDERIHFEVNKMLRYADRVINGNISAFVPVLCSEGIFNKLDKAVVTGAAINAEVQKIEKIDYSIFHREKIDSYQQVDVPHFTNIERYAPDFILFPIYGRNCIMWQDIEGRRKQSHARILMPSLLEQDLSQEIMKMMAHFRWEKCRTDMGAQWNNYRYPSLTSEYTDYLQFYRKNTDLSPEKKEKVKAQLQQCNSKHREVFTKDYQDWILRESVGAMKLNRVSRNIMFTYCPYAQEIAEGVLVQNSYQEAARRYMTEKKKQEKAFVVIERKFEKIGEEMPEEIKQTKKYLSGV